MGTPSWLYYLFAVAMLVVAAYSVGLFGLSLKTADPVGRDIDVAHFGMGIAMAGMFVPHWAFWPASFWEAAFFALTVWFVVRSVQSVQQYGVHVPHEGIHAVMSLAMVLMYLYPMGATGAVMSMTGSSPSSHGILDPGIGLLLAVTFFGSAIFTLGSSHKGSSHHGSHRRHLSAYATVGAPGSVARTSVDANTVGRRGFGILTTPAFEDLSHVVMCVGMGFMLILML
jgi:hypothetical protein